MFEQEKKPLDWVFIRKAKTTFRNRVNRSSYSPKTNTPLLCDGSAEAREIVQNALENTLSVEEKAFGTLRHVLDYLKGKDIESTPSI